MCLTIDERIHTKRTDKICRFGEKSKPKWLVAKTNILCNKYLAKKDNGNYVTPYQSYKVKFVNGRTTIESDYEHNNVRMFVCKSNYSDSHFVNEGIHANIGEGDHLASEKFFAIVPKGTKYYIGRYEDIVAEKLIVFESEDDFMKYMAHRSFITSKWLQLNYLADKELKQSFIGEVLRRRFSVNRFCYL